MMITYLKNMGKFNYNQLKGKSYEELQRLYEREHKWMNDFVPMEFEKEEKKSVEHKKQESAKSDKDVAVDYEHEKEELRIWLTVVPDEEETMDPEILSAKADENTSYHKSLFSMLRKFDRQDFVDLHRLVMKRFEENTPEEAEAESTMAFELLKFIKVGLLGIMDVYKLVLLVQLDTAGDGGYVSIPKAKDIPLHTQIHYSEPTTLFDATDLFVADVHGVWRWLSVGDLRWVPTHDIIEDIAKIIISTIPCQMSDIQPAKKDSSAATTTIGPRSATAKRSLHTDLASEATKKGD
ncbi:hypothetical protein Tco_0556315 [Tanacetum coccineum]